MGIVIGFLAKKIGIPPVLIWLVVILLAALLTWGGIWIYGISKYNDGYAEGQRVERQAWEEQRVKLLLQREAARREAQNKINEAQEKYLRSLDALSAAQLSLQEAKRIQVDEDAQAGTTVVRPFIPSRVSRALDQTGRR